MAGLEIEGDVEETVEWEDVEELDDEGFGDDNDTDAADGEVESGDRL